MEIRYKCKCQREEQTIVVTDRAVGSDVLSWVEGIVSPSIAYHHRAVSPRCFLTAMDYVKIPYDDDRGVGFVPTKN